VDKRTRVAMPDPDRAEQPGPLEVRQVEEEAGRASEPPGQAFPAPAGGPLEDLQQRMGAKFDDISLLRRALTHRSFSNEHLELAGADNERLEFLGDAILDFLAGAYLFEHYPEMQEGELTSLRAALVRTETLAEFATKLGLGPHILLGRGEEASGGRQRPAILCGAFEALIGALYVDQGLSPARYLFEGLLREKVKQILREAADRDPKSELQELSQMACQCTPRYVTIEEKGPDHAKEFTVEAWIGDRPYGQGTGSSKQKAEQEAASAALNHPEVLKLASVTGLFREQEEEDRSNQTSVPSG